MDTEDVIVYPLLTSKREGDHYYRAEVVVSRTGIPDRVYLEKIAFNGNDDATWEDMCWDIDDFRKICAAFEKWDGQS